MEYNNEHNESPILRGESNYQNESDSEFIAEITKRREAALYFNKLVVIVMTLAVSAILVVSIIFFVEGIDSNDSNNSIINLCYLAPTCTPSSQKYDLVTGFTNYTGWQVGDRMTTCCDICQTTSESNVYSSYFNEAQSNNIETRNKVQSVKINSSNFVKKFNDNLIHYNLKADLGYDFLLFDQIWLPQWCNAFSMGHDPTLSHTTGTLCEPSVYLSTPRLSIHGLWPNLFDGFQVCCSSNNPLTINPYKLKAMSNYNDLISQWYDPTVTYDSSVGPEDQNSYLKGSNPKYPVDCSICYLLNHEWQKHGTCFSSSDPEADHTKDDVNYLQSGLIINSVVNATSLLVNAMNGTVVDINDISNLYTNKVNVLCDPQNTIDDDTGYLLEIQTCYIPIDSAYTIDVNNDKKFLSTEELKALGDEPITLANGLQVVPMDCPDSLPSSFTTPCPNKVNVRNFI